jgi:hypothetical protein
MDPEAQTKQTLGLALITIAFSSMVSIGSAVSSLTDKRQAGMLVWILLLGAIALLCSSIYCGGRGIAALRRTGASKPKWFNRQSLFLLGGFFGAVVSLGIWLASPKTNSDVESLKSQLAEVQQQLKVAEAKEQRDEQDIVALRADVAKLTERVQKGKQGRHP